MTRERADEICLDEYKNLVRYCRWPRDPRTGKNLRTKKGRQIIYPLETAEDLAHDTILKFIERHTRISDGEGDNPTGYLYAVAYSIIIEYGRKPPPVPYGMLEGIEAERNRQRQASVYPKGPRPGVNRHAAECQDLAAADWSAMYEAINELPEQQAQAIRLYYGLGTAGAGMTYKQIAALMNTTEDYVGKMLTQARKYLTARLKGVYTGGQK